MKEDSLNKFQKVFKPLEKDSKKRKSGSIKCQLFPSLRKNKSEFRTMTDGCNKKKMDEDCWKCPYMEEEDDN